METICPGCHETLGSRVAWCSTCGAWLRAIVDGVSFVEELGMQGTLFESGQYVSTPVSGVKPEHAECQRTGFAWELQVGLFGGEQAICSRCQTVRPYDTERAS